LNLSSSGPLGPVENGKASKGKKLLVVRPAALTHKIREPSPVGGKRKGTLDQGKTKTGVLELGGANEPGLQRGGRKPVLKAPRGGLKGRTRERGKQGRLG